MINYCHLTICVYIYLGSYIHARLALKLYDLAYPLMTTSDKQGLLKKLKNS